MSADLPAATRVLNEVCRRLDSKGLTPDRIDEIRTVAATAIITDGSPFVALVEILSDEEFDAILEVLTN